MEQRPYRWADPGPRLDARLDKSGGPDACWPYQGVRDRKGYGRFWWKGKAVFTHRAAWEVANGRRPIGCVLHKCDNPPCCNPAHLFEGTHRDNIADMNAKGRHEHGAAHHLAKVSDDVVRQARSLREQGLSYGKVAAIVGVGYWTARNWLKPKPMRPL